MNIIKKTLLFFALAALTLSIATATYASEREDIAPDTEESLTEPHESDADGAEDTAKNPFEEIFNTLGEYSSEIFSALAFIGTLIVAYFYKKGMLPTLKKALSGISTALSTAGEKTEGSLLPIAERTEEIALANAAMKEAVDTALDSLSRLEEKLDGQKEEKNERQAFKTVMLSQVDMLYDIFMSSSLPQYKKDEIGEKIGAMREELKLCNEGTK